MMIDILTLVIATIIVFSAGYHCGFSRANNIVIDECLSRLKAREDKE